MYNILEQVFGLLFGLGFPLATIILIVWQRQKSKRERDRLYAELYAKAIDKGQSMPDNLFPQQMQKDSRYALKSGIICIVTALGWMVAFSVIAKLSSQEFAEAVNPATILVALGLIPLFIGIGFVLIHFLKKKSADGK